MLETLHEDNIFETNHGCRQMMMRQFDEYNISYNKLTDVYSNAKMDGNSSYECVSTGGRLGGLYNIV